MPEFSHSGKFGDLIYGMPAMRALGGGKLWLHPDDSISGYQFSEIDLNVIAPLMLAQDYISDVALTTRGVKPGHDLDLFRKNWRSGKPITYHHLKAFGLPDSLGIQKWIDVPPSSQIAPVVINVAFRYMTDQFPWKKVVKAYGDQAVFIGLECEHARFCHEFGEVQHHRTDDMLEAAQVINECDLYIGSQSSCLALAQGLRKRCIIDYWARDICALRTPEQILGWPESLPEIKIKTT